MTPQTPPAAPARPSSSLATRITVIVFWGLALVGVALAFFLLHDLERQVEQRQLGHTNQLAYRIESRLPLYPDTADAATSAWLERLRRDSGGALGIELYRGDERVARAGAAQRADHVLERDVHAPVDGVVDTYRVVVHWPALEQSVQVHRNRVLLGLGALLLVFGVLLHRILDRVLARPMSQMFTTAQSISEGHTDLRFDSARNDELGYMAGFMNQGLDTVLRQRDQLKRTLEQLNQSKRELQQEKERAQTTLTSIGDGVITTDAEGQVLYMNAAAWRLTGWSADELTGRSLSRYVRFLREGEDITDRAVAECLQRTDSAEFVNDIDLVQRDGEHLPIHLSLAPLQDSNLAAPGCVIVIRDVSDTRRLHRELSYQATHDPVTGLYNRRELEERLHIATQEAARDGVIHCLCYVDLDRFKVVNDTCGHGAGDMLICQAAERLRHRLRQSDLLARLGADEFAVLLRYCPVDKAEGIAEAIRTAVAELPFHVAGASFRLSASVGVIPVSGEDRHVSELITAADATCHDAKEHGGNRVQLARSDAGELDRRRSEIAWVTELDEILAGDRLRLYCQPIVPVQSPEVRNEHEVLVRMTDRDGELISPGTFIPVAERYGLMPQLDRWVVSHALDFLAEHDQERRLFLSVNLSAQSLCDPEFLGFVVGCLERPGAPAPRQICFEVTETAAMRNVDSATRFITELRARGCRFALDDFGSGLSSLGYLKQLEVDVLKIDGVFIRNIVDDAFDRAMVGAVTELATAMGVETVAEFVENDAVVEVIRELGVDYAQGFGIDRPQPIERLIGATPINSNRDRKAGEG